MIFENNSSKLLFVHFPVVDLLARFSKLSSESIACRPMYFPRFGCLALMSISSFLPSQFEIRRLIILPFIKMSKRSHESGSAKRKRRELLDGKLKQLPRVDTFFTPAVF